MARTRHPLSEPVARTRHPLSEPVARTRHPLSEPVARTRHPLSYTNNYMSDVISHYQFMMSRGCYCYDNGRVSKAIATVHQHGQWFYVNVCCSDLPLLLCVPSCSLCFNAYVYIVLCPFLSPCVFFIRFG